MVCMGESAIDLDKLSVEDRLRLLERLWDSLTDEDLPLSEAQRAELDRRLDELEAESPRGIPWDEVMRRLERPA